MRKAQPLSISNSLGAASFLSVAILKPTHVSCQCVSIRLCCYKTHINGGWLCFGWTGGFLASLHRWGMGWKGRGASSFFVVVTLEWLRLARHGGGGTFEGFYFGATSGFFIIIHGWKFSLFQRECSVGGVKGFF